MDPAIIGQFIGAPANALTLVMVVGLILSQMVDKGLIKIGKFGQEKTPQWAKRLDAYFNHDTTNHHQETQRLLTQLIAMEEKEHQGTQEIRDYIRDNTKVLERLERDGIRCKT